MSTNGNRPVDKILLTEHLVVLKHGSGIDPAVIEERGYESVLKAHGGRQLLDAGFSKGQLDNLGGILMPIFAPNGDQSLYTYRPDEPKGSRKYIIPSKAQVRLDVHPRNHDKIKDAKVPLWITEGIKKGDALTSHGFVALTLMGVWNWRGTNAQGGKTALGDWEDVALDGREVVIVFDADVVEKRLVKLARERLTAFLQSRGSKVFWCHLPTGPEGKVDDYLLRHTADELQARVSEAPEINRQKMSAERTDVAEFARNLWEIILEDTSNPTIFRGPSGLVSLSLDENNRISLSPVSQDSLLYRISDEVEFFKTKFTANGPQTLPAKPPRDIVDLMIANISPDVPVILAVATMPYFTKDGKLVSLPGYNWETKIYLDLAQPIEEVPEHPTEADVQAARELWEHAVVDFPFTDQADKANIFGLAVSIPARLMIEGPMPFHLINASDAGSGKGLLAHTVLTPMLGYSPVWKPEPENDAEWRKTITATVMAGSNIFAVDNLKRTVSSGSLCAAGTTDTWEDRILGQSKTIRGKITWAWAMTGNNIAMDVEVLRRSVITRLVPQVEKPGERDPSEFTEPNQKGWVARNSVALNRAILTLIQAWIDKGQPDGKTVFGSYESWCRVVGGVLDTAGVTGFLTNRQKSYETVDTDLTRWQEFVAAWLEEYGNSEVKVADLLGTVTMKAIDLGLTGYTDRALRTSFAMQLSRNKDRVVSGQRIQQGKSRSSWQLVSIDGTEKPRPKAGVRRDEALVHEMKFDQIVR